MTIPLKVLSVQIRDAVGNSHLDAAPKADSLILLNPTDTR